MNGLSRKVLKVIARWNEGTIKGRGAILFCSCVILLKFQISAAIFEKTIKIQAYDLDEVCNEDPGAS